MAVISLCWLVAASAWLPAVSASLGREQPAPGGPIQTPAPNLKEPARALAVRAVTQPPHARALLQKRDTNTCGYVNGNSMSGYVCNHSLAQCLFNTEASAVGCCLTTSCNIYTACLPYASSAATTTVNMDRTRYCSDSRYPYCAVLSYADPTGSLSGYTIPTCDSTSTTYKFYFSAFGANTPTSRSSSRLTLTTVSSESSSSETSSSSSRSASDTTSPAPVPVTSSATPDPGSSTPVGPIVGGVVGGVAALGLIGLGVFFLVRRKKQDPASPPAAPPPAPAPAQGFMPPPGQGPYPNQTPPPNMGIVPGAPGAFDPRYSMAKPPMATSVNPVQGPPMSPMTVTPTGSPPPLYQPQMQPMGPPMGMATPPPHHAMGTPPPMAWARLLLRATCRRTPSMLRTPGPQMQPPPQQQYHGAVELSTQRGDGQVHELS
ncbi:hypothetical protein NEMBOFW57_009140 [Staphylotrichum longicolle]|uniref:Epidermal growth factor receptor-like transmembrane-juxtamembrane segment domain-containing protein n=1 Tax=Staphylotrichum longicolle TaxID=669026 RepID=A0AAD4EWW7_9PEZI|nr:hypothetical protein NEMBOFW57_009140 [Staphylotrichum longicolle]